MAVLLKHAVMRRVCMVVSPMRTFHLNIVERLKNFFRAELHLFFKERMESKSAAHISTM